jgi:hypothetical protein
MVRNQQPEDPVKITALVNDLGSKDGIVRQKARNALVQIGLPAMESLIVAFETKKNAYAHWEAAKAISTIGGPEAVRPLLHALSDDDFSIRWIATEGLIAVGGIALESLAKVLVLEETPPFFYESSHHFIHDLVSKKIIDEETITQIEPLLKAFSKTASTQLVSQEAARFLDWLRTNRL